jgi:hypothetical protein
VKTARGDFGAATLYTPCSHELEKEKGKKGSRVHGRGGNDAWTASDFDEALSAKIDGVRAAAAAGGWEAALEAAVQLLNWSFIGSKKGPDYYRRYVDKAVKVEFAAGTTAVARGEQFALICSGGEKGPYPVRLSDAHRAARVEAADFSFARG